MSEVDEKCKICNKCDRCVKNELINDYLRFIDNCNDKELQKRFYTQYLEYKTRIAIERWRCGKLGIVCGTIVVCFCIIKNLLFK